MADLVSILIPTRNRPLLARLCVETALESSDADCEIVVADNGDQSLELPAHPRLRVLPPPGRPLAMPDNWERALDAARGEWVMLLSDKYMLVPGAMDALRRQMRCGERLIYYVYGVFRQNLDERGPASLPSLAEAGGELTWYTPTASRVASSHATLERMASTAGTYPVWAPMLYTSLAHRTLMAGTREKGQRFFFGPCPDIASALRLLVSTDTFLVTRIPAVMAQYPSQSPEWSTGASTQVGGPAGRTFLEQLGSGAPTGLVSLVSVLMQLTLLDGCRRMVELRAFRPAWTSLAAHGAREIESLPPRQRLRFHWRLARFVLSGGGSLAPLWVQLRAAAGLHAPAPCFARTVVGGCSPRDCRLGIRPLRPRAERPFPCAGKPSNGWGRSHEATQKPRSPFLTPATWRGKG